MKQMIRTLARPAVWLAAAGAIGGAPCAWAGEASSAPPCATRPAARNIDYPWMPIARWQQFYLDHAARAAQGDIDVMFVGDSITEMWPKPVWDANFGRLKPANFGIGGDHTGNLLWRLQTPSIAALTPKLVVLLIGVNNLNLCGEAPEQVFDGIRAVVDKLRKQYPAARILLNAVLPTGELPESAVRQRVNALNRMVRTLGDNRAVFFHDYGPRLLGADGKLSAQLQPDFLHLSEQGYRIWADALRPDIEQLLK